MSKRKKKPLTYKDLVPVEGEESFLYCPSCGGHFSSHSADYWQENPDSIITHCQTPVIRLAPIVIYKEV